MFIYFGIFSQILAQTEVYSFGNFIIKYSPKEIPKNNNTKYKSILKNHIAGKVPIYVQDMAVFLQTAFDKYCDIKIASKYNYTFKNDARYTVTKDSSLKIIPIYIEDIGASDGETIAIGDGIKMNIFVKPYKNINASTALQKACIHELLHYFTKEKYSLLFGVSVTKWWWEVMASQADRLVYPNTKPFEAELAADTLSEQINRSWDDCNYHPNWYKASGFLSYLLYYKPGQKPTFEKLFYTPTQEPTSKIIISLDKYLKGIGSKSIGWDYHDYLKMAYEFKNFATIGDSTGSSFSHTLMVRLNDTFKYDTIKANLPYMTAKIIRIKNFEDRSKKIIIKNIAENKDNMIYLYESKIGKNRDFIKQIGYKDSLIYNFKNKQKWIDALIINTSNDNSETAQVAVIEALNAEGNYTGTIEFADDNEKFKKIYQINIANLKIDINDKNAAIGNVEFHMDYKKDGMLATGSEISGTVDPYGNCKFQGRIKETNYPKCKIGCCTYELIKQGSQCMQVTKYLYWHFDGKLIITGKNKDIKGNITVSSTANIKKKEAATLKYSLNATEP